MKLPEGMHVLERGWLSSNNIVFIDSERTAIVDTGYKSHEEQTLTLVQTLLAGRPLEVIYNTHLHSDHCGGNRHRALARQPDQPRRRLYGRSARQPNTGRQGDRRRLDVDAWGRRRGDDQGSRSHPYRLPADRDRRCRCGANAS